MPKYKLHGNCYLNDRYLQAGSEVEFDGKPNGLMEPMDAAAWAAFHAYDASRAPGTKYPFKVTERKAAEVEIPEDWEDLKGLSITHLAVRLGAPRTSKGPAAKKFIEAEVARREAAKQGQ